MHLNTFCFPLPLKTKGRPWIPSIHYKGSRSRSGTVDTLELSELPGCQIFTPLNSLARSLPFLWGSSLLSQSGLEDGMRMFTTNHLLVLRPPLDEVA